MRFLSVGVGAIGGTIAAHLARAGEDLVAVDSNRDYAEAMKRHGLTLEAQGGAFIASVRALHWEEIDGLLETVLLAVKSESTEHAVRQLLPHLA